MLLKLECYLEVVAVSLEKSVFIRVCSCLRSLSLVFRPLRKFYCPFTILLLYYVRYSLFIRRGVCRMEINCFLHLYLLFYKILLPRLLFLFSLNLKSSDRSFDLHIRRSESRMSVEIVFLHLMKPCLSATLIISSLLVLF